MPLKGHRSSSANRLGSRSNSAAKLGAGLQFTQTGGKKAAADKPAFHRQHSAQRIHSREQMQPLRKVHHGPSKHNPAAVQTQAPTAATASTHTKAGKGGKSGFTIDAEEEDDDDEWVSSSSGHITPNHDAGSGSDGEGEGDDGGQELSAVIRALSNMPRGAGDAQHQGHRQAHTHAQTTMPTADKDSTRREDNGLHGVDTAQAAEFAPETLKEDSPLVQVQQQQAAHIPQVYHGHQAQQYQQQAQQQQYHQQQQHHAQHQARLAHQQAYQQQQHEQQLQEARYREQLAQEQAYQEQLARAQPSQQQQQAHEEQPAGVKGKDTSADHTPTHSRAPSRQTSPRIPSQTQKKSRPPSTYSTSSKHDGVRPHPLIRGQSFGGGVGGLGMNAAKGMTINPIKPSKAAPQLSTSPTSSVYEDLDPKHFLPSSPASTTGGSTYGGRRTSIGSTHSGSTLPHSNTHPRGGYDRTRTLSSMSTSSSSTALSALSHLPTSSIFSSFSQAQTRPPSPQAVVFFPPVNPHAYIENIHPLLPGPYLQNHLAVLSRRVPLRESYDRVHRAKAGVGVAS